MERRKALALSVVATVMVLAMVGMAVSLVRMTLEGDARATPMPVVTTGGSADPASTAITNGEQVPLEPVVEYLDVYEVVPGSSAATGSGTGPTGAAQTAPATANTAPGTGAAAGTSGAAPPAVGVTPASPQPTTAAPPPAPTTTVAPRPAGVPSDWPANKPIPPMPAGCRDPQLEDNGVWNCQH